MPGACSERKGHEHRAGRWSSPSQGEGPQDRPPGQRLDGGLPASSMERTYVSGVEAARLWGLVGAALAN